MSKSFIHLSALLSLLAFYGCAKPTDSVPPSSRSSSIALPGSAKNTSPQSAQEGSPEKALLRRVVAYQVERLLEDADKKGCQDFIELDAEVEKVRKEFSAAYDRFDVEIDSASQLSGDPFQDFAPARQAQSDYQAAEKKLKELDERNDKKRKEFYAVRQAWFESKGFVSQANNEFVAAVQGSLNARRGLGSVSVKESARQYERQFVQNTKSGNADNKEIQAAADEYEKILALVENKIAEVKAVAKPAADDVNLRRRKFAYRNKARDLLAKPFDASTNKAFAELRKEGQELASLENSLDKPAVERHGPLEKELADLEQQYDEAFKKVALLMPIDK